MAEPAAPVVDHRAEDSAEIVRLNEIVRALMDRAERTASVQGSDFGVFQTAVLLEEEVGHRTAELEAALSENEKITRALRESEAKFRVLVSQSLVGIVLIEDGRFSYANATFEAMLGYSAGELHNMSPMDLAVEGDRRLVAEHLRRRVAGEVDHVEYVLRARRKDGSIVIMDLRGSRIDVNGRPVLVTLSLDITERTRAEAEVRALQAVLKEQSTHDALTGLYNRRFLEESLERELVLAARTGHPISVIMGDLDHFKAINDRHGHPAGDEVLRRFGALLRGGARGSDIYCRYGGEEFLLVLPRMDEGHALERAEQIRQAVASAPITHDGATIRVTASFGVATYPRDGGSGDALIGAADRALYAAKAGGRDQVVSAAALK